MRPPNIIAGPAPSILQARGMATPYQMHHGGADATVPLTYDIRLDPLLTSLGVEHELIVYPGADHLAVRFSPAMLTHVHDWYAAHGMF